MSFFRFPVYDIPELSADNNAPDTDLQLSVYVLHRDYGEEEQALLQKILGATKIDNQQLNIREYYPTSPPVMRLNDQVKNLVLSFGLTSQELGLQVDNTKYQMIRIGKLSVLFLDPLSKIKADASLKKALWSNLKNYFNL